MKPIDEIKHLTKEINKHNNLYYNLNTSTISDSDWDALFQQLVALEKEHPHLIQSDSPTSKVGGSVDVRFTPVTHQPPMLSLDNAFDKEQLATWYNKLPPNTVVIAEPKLDGLALSLDYELGLLKTASTRGDGVTGENVTHSARVISNLPKVLKSATDRTIRGEVVISKRAFNEYNDKMIATGGKLFINERNAVAGTMRRTKATPDRPVEFIAYELITDEEDHLRQMRGLASNGFSTTLSIMDGDSIPCKSLEDLYQIVDSLTNGRSEFPYPIDGIVFKVVDYKLREELGSTSRIPKWAIAYKFPAMEGISKLKDIVYQVGRSGAITPVAKIAPVFVGGVTITSVTLHNFKEIERLGVLMGDPILVVRAGDVIPKITSVKTELRTGKETSIDLPTKCPACDTGLEVTPTGLEHYCPNHTGCPEQIALQIQHYTSRDAIDIDGIGRSLIDLLLEHKLVKNAADLYKLDVKMLEGLPRLGEKSINNLIGSMLAAKNPPLDRFIYSLGVPTMGRSVSKILADKYLTLDRIRRVTKEELMGIKGMGESITDAIVGAFNDPHVNGLIDSLLEVGVQPIEVEADTSPKPLEGETWVITGAFENYNRTQIKATLESLGAKVSGSVSSKTSRLVSTDDTSTKHKKAVKLNTPIFTEAEYIEFINNLSVKFI